VTTNVALCDWLHESLDVLPVFSYPFDVAALPSNGVYFFYEVGECCGHHAAKPRIVRVGTHRDGNFQSRIAEHFLLNERKMAFTQDAFPTKKISLVPTAPTPKMVAYAQSLARGRPKGARGGRRASSS